MDGQVTGPGGHLALQHTVNDVWKFEAEQRFMCVRLEVDSDVYEEY